MPDVKSTSGPSRLTEAPGKEPVDPFRKAESLSRCELYWLPASLPAKEQQRKWALQFLSELVKRLAAGGRLQTELFVEAEAIYPDRQEQFIQTALDFNPVMGFSRVPGAPLPSIPKTEDTEAIRRQEKPFELKPFLRGICYWFLRKNPQKQLELFWGWGGMTMLLVKPDPAAQAPPLVVPAGVQKHPAYQSMAQQYDIPGMLSMAASAQSEFLKKSKTYFGKGWEDRLEYRGLLYVLPRWCSQDFFHLPEEEVKHLFEICDLFVTESPADKGVLLASSKPIRPIIHEVVTSLREAGHVFPDRT